VVALENLEEFRRYRERMNKRVLDGGNLGIKRFFALDSRAYEKGVLDNETKELLGLMACLEVQRLYHLPSLTMLFVAW
jgi:hypothetical protein